MRLRKEGRESERHKTARGREEEGTRRREEKRPGRGSGGGRWALGRDGRAPGGAGGKNVFLLRGP